MSLAWEKSEWPNSTYIFCLVILCGVSTGMSRVRIAGQSLGAMPQANPGATKNALAGNFWWPTRDSNPGPLD